jgi:hypothetical protein
MGDSTRRTYKVSHNASIPDNTTQHSFHSTTQQDYYKMSKQLSVFAMLAPLALADIYPVALPSWDLNGPQSGVGSWYRASAGQDSTNGKSWCAYEYYNSDPIFAPVRNDPWAWSDVLTGALTWPEKSLKHMGGATYNSNPTAWKQQTQKFCGLEAKVTDPSTGKTSLLYIGDSFDDHYVKVSSGSKKLGNVTVLEAGQY